MTVFLNPKTGATQGSPENHGTQAEPFTVAMAWQPSTLSFVALSLDASGNLNTAGGGGGGGGAVTVADGADVAEGATSDAAVTTDVAGTVSGKLRGLVKILASAWDSVNGRLKVDGSGVTQPVSGPLTDTQLRASAVPVSGPLTDTQLRASAVPISAANLDVALSTRLKPADTLAAVTSLTQFNGQPIALNTGVRSAGTLRVTVATDDSVPVTNANLDVALSTRLKPADTLTKVTTVDTITNAVTVAQATAASLNATVTQGPGAAAGTSWRSKGDQARGSATIADPVILGGRSTDYPTSTPTAVSAGQVVDLALDLKGVQVVRPRQIPTYVAVYRLALAAASSSLTFTFTANTDKQLATIYHANTATKRVSVRRVWVQILKTGAVAGELQLEMRRLSATTAPATGNPAITPVARDSSAAGAEATCLSLPTTAGSETLSNSPLASSILNLAASVGTASGTGTLPQDPMWIKLYDEASADDEEVAPIIRAGVAEGFAIVGRSTAAIPLNFIVRVVFSEE